MSKNQRKEGHAACYRGHWLQGRSLGLAGVATTSLLMVLRHPAHLATSLHNRPLARRNPCTPAATLRLSPQDNRRRRRCRHRSDCYLFRTAKRG